MRTLFLTLTVFLFPMTAYAHIAISEVMWMGSDRSTSDEWVEIASDEPTSIDLSGWTLTSLNSKGEHALILRFQTGTTLDTEQVMVIANLPASTSRLLYEPDFVTSAMSLPNTKLLLTLRDAKGNIVDQVDDGVGAPFAGANPSGGAKASMERISLVASGTESSNWQTATQSSGFDPGGSIFGTPGTFPFTPSSPNPPPPSPPSCSDPLEIAIYVQDGELFGVGHTTVNFQAVATAGSIQTATCRWTFSDGYSSDSCNPPPHSFTLVGITSVNLEAVNQCGNTLKQQTKVTVQADSNAQSPSSAQTSPSFFDASRIHLMSALPNPEGSETGHEWVEIRSREERPISLQGWTLAVGKTSIKRYPLSGSINALSRLRLYDSELKFKLPNSESSLTLIDPTGKDVSSIHWKVAEEGVQYFSDDIHDLEIVTGRVVSVIDGDTFVFAPEGEARELLDADSIHVRILGIDAPELLSGEPYSYEAYEHLSALIKNKRIELHFDTDIWDKYGRLLAYISTEDVRDPALDLLSLGLASVTRVFTFSALDHYSEIESSSKLKKIGIWSTDQDSIVVLNTVDSNSKESASPIDQDSLINQSGASIVISEIYPAPTKVLNSIGALEEKKRSIFEQNNSTIFNSEWIELQTDPKNTQSLSGWKFSINGKVKSLKSGLEWGSNGFALINLTEMKLHLRNDGAILSLLSPDGSEVSSVLYPAMKDGYSYAYSSQDDAYCLSVHPTPGEQNVCISPTTKTRASTQKKRAKLAKYARDLGSSDGDTLSIVDADHSSNAFVLYFLSLLLVTSCILLIIVRYRKV